jgi:hypothetical protein
VKIIVSAAAAILLAVLCVVLAGCGSIRVARTSRARVTPSAPAPVSTAARLTSNCVMGYEQPTLDSNGFATSDYNSGFLAGPPEGVKLGGNYYAPALAYQVTLTDNSASTASVAAISVIFYDASGTEAGSDQQSTTGLIAGGQSLTWTELASTAVDGSGDGGNDPGIPASAASCDLVGWSGP